MRIGELLALRWSDIELTAPPERRNDEDRFPWLMVNGQIPSKGNRVDYGKTDAAIRPIALPDWAAALLRRRKVAQTPNDLEAVFVTRNGTWHYPTNIPGRLRHLRLLDDYADLTVLQGVTPHSFRRTVATEIDEVYDAEAAKNQLGHTSKTVTERHYINRRLVVPDYRAATERLAPGRGKDQGTGPTKWAPTTAADGLLPPAANRAERLAQPRGPPWSNDALRVRTRAMRRATTRREA